MYLSVFRDPARHPTATGTGRDPRPKRGTMDVPVITSPLATRNPSGVQHNTRSSASASTRSGSAGQNRLALRSRSKLERIMGEDAATLSPASKPVSPAMPPQPPDPLRSRNRGLGLLPSLLHRWERANSPSPSHFVDLQSPTSRSSGSEPATSQVGNSTPATSEDSSLTSSHLGLPPTAVTRYGSTLRPAARANDARSMLDIVDERECPLCLEPLSLRLRGERYVVPKCGHMIHHECFTLLYGNPKSVLASQQRQRQLERLGPAYVRGDDGLVCQVCRRHLELTTQQNVVSKVERVTGMVRHLAASPASRDSVFLHGSPSSHLVDPNGDDTAKPQRDEGSMLKPSLTIEPEFDTLWKRVSSQGRDGTQTFPTLIRVSVPRRRPDFEPADPRPRNDQAAPSMVSGESSVRPLSVSSAVTSTTSTSSASSRRRPQQNPLIPSSSPLSGDIPASAPLVVEEAPLKPYIMINKELYDLPEEDTLSSSPLQALDQYRLPSFDLPPRPAPPPPVPQTADSDLPSPGPIVTGADVRKRVKDDLYHRMIDWKGHHLESCGDLHMMDTLNVFKEHIVRRFSVYMFQQAILCTLEDHRRPLAPPLSIPRPSASDSSASGACNQAHTPLLRLKGWIYFRHIHSVTNTSTEEQPSLSIRMTDNLVNEFVLAFESKRQAQVWKEQMDALVDAAKNPDRPVEVDLPDSLTGKYDDLESLPLVPNLDVSYARTTFDEEDGLMPPEAPSGADTANQHLPLSILSSHGSAYDSVHSNTVPHSVRSSTSSAQPFAANGDQALKPPGQDALDWQSWRSSFGSSVALPELLPHAPLDLVLMVVLPARAEAEEGGEQGDLKSSQLRSTLDFILASLGEQDRLSLVAFCPGLRSNGAFVAKTRLLRVGVGVSRDTLFEFLDMLAEGTLSSAEQFVEDTSQYPSSGASRERVDGTSALHVGLDIMLQRMSKNPVAGMVFVDDALSAFRRAAMDSVLSRADAAGVPIHCFGLGPGHDPSSLWLVATQTLGTYTCVRHLTELRVALAGCVGSLLSVALTEVNVRVTIPKNNEMFVRRAAGASAAIISADGKYVDVHLGTIYYGQVREVLLDIELNFEAVRKLIRPSLGSVPESLRDNMDGVESSRKKAASGLGMSDDYLAQFGFDAALLESSATVPDLGTNIPFDVMEEVVVLEADLSFQDPATLHMAKRLGLGGPRTLAVEVDVFRPDHLATLSPATVAALARASVTRRRFEILSHEMIARSLLLASRHNITQASLLLQQTRKMLGSILDATPGYVPAAAPEATPPGLPSSDSGSNSRALHGRTEHGVAFPPRSGLTADSSTAVSTANVPEQDGHKATVASLSAVVEDVDLLLGFLNQEWEGDPLTRSASLLRSAARPSSTQSRPSPSTLPASSPAAPGDSAFEQQGRQYAAQQAMVLLQQTAWTRRTPTEHFRFRADNGPALASLAWTEATTSP